MFEYEPTGRIRVVGCAGVKIKKNFLALFTVGSRVYIRKSARIGELKSVVIKRFAKSLADSLDKYSNPIVMYTDTFNRVWAENELLSEENAADQAMIYLKNIAEEGKRLFEENGCFPLPNERCG
jgi:hypothetical protein